LKEAKKRERLDLLLMEHFPGISRSRARAEIMSGRVLVEGQVCSKPGCFILVTPRSFFWNHGDVMSAGVALNLPGPWTILA